MPLHHDQIGGGNDLIAAPLLGRTRDNLDSSVSERNNGQQTDIDFELDLFCLGLNLACPIFWPDAVREHCLFPPTQKA